MKSILSGLALVVTMAMTWAAPAWAAEPAALEGPRALRLKSTETPPVIDGGLDEALWQRAPIYDRFVQFQPEDKKPAPWRTTVQVVASADALIFGIRAYDPAPDLIRAPLTRRDRVRRDQDFVSVVIDPVGQRRSAQFVRISASGVLADGLFTADDDVEDFSPDFELEAAAQRLPDGYSIELRWPLASLRFPHSEGLPWRVMVVRNMPRDEAASLMLSAPLTKEALSFIAELQVLGGLDDLVEQVRERSFISIRPELTARRLQVSEPGQPNSRSQSLNLGGELKWRPRADWVIDATLNPDFSQVELDAPQLAGNTRFALSQQEKRPFFLESTDVVGQSQPDDEGQNRGLAAFYSRAITDPDWGLRATWRGALAEATALSLRDAGGGQVLRANAFGTASFAQPGVSQASLMRGRMQLAPITLGGLVSLRDYGQGRRNEVLGSDFAWAPGAGDAVRGHLLWSRTSVAFDAQGQAQSGSAASGHHLWLAWRHRSEDWSNQLHLEDVSPRFANDNGFVSQAGFRRVTLNLHQKAGSQSLAPLGEWSRFQAYELDWQLKLVQAQTLADAELGVPGNRLIERRLQPGFWLASERNTGVWAHLGLDQQRAKSDGPVHAPRTVLLGFESSPNAWLTFVNAELEWGRRLDVEADRLGRGASLWLEARLRLPSPKGFGLELEQQVGQSYVNNPQGQRGFTDSNWQTLLVLHVSPHDSLRAIAQHSQFQRRAELGLNAAQDSSNHFSLVYTHRQGLNRVFSLGLSQADERPSRQRSTEVFAKAQVGWQR